MSEELREQAFQCHHQGELEQAERLYRQALEQAPQNSDIIYMLGVIAGQKKNYSLAIDRIQQALALSPGQPVYHYNLGKAFKGSQQLESALSHFQQAIHLNPAYTQAHYQAGQVLQQLERLPEAIPCYQEALKQGADGPEIHACLGLAFQTMGKIEEALLHYRQALEQGSSQAGVHNNLGNLLQQLGQLEEAMGCYHQALAIEPAFIDAWHNLGSALEKQRQFQEAVACYQKVLQQEPASPDTWNNLGNLFREMREPQPAIQCYRAALNYNPAFAAAWNNLGTLCLETGQMDKALFCFESLLKIQPHQTKAHIQLAEVYRREGETREALQHYRAALEQQPDNPEAHYGMIESLQAQGNGSEAMQYYAEILDRHSSQLDALAGKASILERAREFEKGYALLQPVIEAGRATPLVAAIYGTLCLRLKRYSEAIPVLEMILKTPYLSDTFQRHLSYRLADLYDAAGMYEKAFICYQQANELSSQYFNAGAQAVLTDKITATFQSGWLQTMGRASQSARPIFIVGMPRSGTTLVEQILASHPAVFGAGELKEIAKLFRSLTASAEDSWPDFRPCFKNPSDLEALVCQYLEKLEQLAPPNAERVTDKMPGNFLYLGFIELLFPQARVIHCTRHPLDTCLSCYFKDFQELPYAHNLEHLAAFYKQYQRLMGHWKKVLSVPILEVPYEQLVANQETFTRQLIAFCGLPWDEHCLRFYETERFIQTASYDQVRRPLYSSSVGRYRHYAPFLDPLKALLADD